MISNIEIKGESVPWSEISPFINENNKLKEQGN
jgi:hypothetical protein